MMAALSSSQLHDSGMDHIRRFSPSQLASLQDGLSGTFFRTFVAA
jgi:hypothetical protein